MIEDPTSREAEAFRTLRTNVDFANLPLQAASIMVVSGHEREGKSTTITNLAVAFAETGRSVVLVDLDLRRPFAHRFFGLDVNPGFTDVIISGAQLEDALRPVDIAGAEPTGSSPLAISRLDVLTAGVRPVEPATLLALDAARDLLRELRDLYDIVLIDTPPMLAVSDAMIISANADAILVVAHAERLRRDELAELGRVLSIGRTPRLGVVRTASESGSQSGYGYGYGYGYQPEEAEGSNGRWRERIGL